MLLQCKTNDPYTEIGDYIDEYCLSKLGYYTSFLVTIEINGAEITEILSFETDSFIWDSDWWEGEQDIKLLGFRPISDIKCYGLPEEDDTN